jgi:hypothetical protein
MDWSGGSRVGFLQTQLFPVCQTLAAKGLLSLVFIDKIRAFIYISNSIFLKFSQLIQKVKKSI